MVNSNENTLTLVTPGAQLSAQLALTFSSSTSTLQDVKARGNLLYTVASGSNTVQKIDLSASGGPSLVDEKSVGTCDQATGVCPGPWNILPLDDDQALVTNQGSSTIVAVKWSH